MKKGIYLILLTTLISGFSVFSNKIFVSQTDPLVFALVRNVIMAVIFSLLMLFSKKKHALAHLKKTEWLKLLLIGVCGGGLAFGLFFVGLSAIPAVQGSLIHKSLFLWVTFLAIPLLGERLTKIQLIGYAVVTYATFFMGGMQLLQLNLGSLMVLGATILWAIENVIAKKALQNIDPLIISWARMVIGLPVLLVAVVIVGKTHILFNASSFNLLSLTTSSLFLTGYMLSWYAGLRYVPVTLATSLLVFAPIITLFLSTIFFTPTLLATQIPNVLLITIGLTFILGTIKKSSLAART